MQAGRQVGYALDLDHKRNSSTALNENFQQSMHEMYINLDDVAWHSNYARDLSAILFIMVTFHSLKLMQRVPWGVGTKVTAITSIFVHHEVVPFYIVLMIGTVAFSAGYFFAYGDSVLEYRHPIESTRHILLMTLLGENMPGEAELSDDNLAFYYSTLFLIIFVLVLSKLAKRCFLLFVILLLRFFLKIHEI